MSSQAFPGTVVKRVAVLTFKRNNLSDLPTRLPAGEIVRIEGQRNYSLIYLSTGARFRVSINLQAFGQRLPTFWRVHKSHLVNPTYVKTVLHINGRYRCVALQSGEWLPISRREYQRNKFRIQPSTSFH